MQVRRRRGIRAYGDGTCKSCLDKEYGLVYLKGYMSRLSPDGAINPAGPVEEESWSNTDRKAICRR